jgi:hypothetical protein
MQKLLKLLGISVLGTIVVITVSLIVGRGIEANRERKSKEELVEEQNKLKEKVNTPSSLATNEVKNIEKLPPHNVASRVSLGGNRERIQINTADPKLSNVDCEKLANHYKPQAGQVSVHKPSLKLKKLYPTATEKEIMQPFCVNNLDEKGTFFNDYFF